MGQWLCEYKGLVYPYSERERHLVEYDKNGGGSYRTPSGKGCTALLGCHAPPEAICAPTHYYWSSHLLVARLHAM